MKIIEAVNYCKSNNLNFLTIDRNGDFTAFRDEPTNRDSNTEWYDGSLMRIFHMLEDIDDMYNLDWTKCKLDVRELTL